MWIKPVPILARTESCRSRATEFRWKGARDIRTVRTYVYTYTEAAPNNYVRIRERRGICRLSPLVCMYVCM